MEYPGSVGVGDELKPPVLMSDDEGGDSPDEGGGDEGEGPDEAAEEQSEGHDDRGSDPQP